MRHKLTCALCVLTAGLASAAERDAVYPRLVGQLLVGTSGFEPGAAGEFTWSDMAYPIRLRPEVFVNEDGDIGVGLSVAWRVTQNWIGDHDELYVGPRLAFHNSDDHGWEGSAMAVYSFPIVRSMPDRHFLEVIGAAGIVDDRSEPHHHSEFAGTIGVAYAYQF